MSEKECARRRDWQVLLGQITFGHGKDFGFYSECDGRPNVICLLKGSICFLCGRLKGARVGSSENCEEAVLIGQLREESGFD